MQLGQFRTYATLAVVILIVAACGPADPTFVPGGTSSASPTQDATPSATTTQVAPFSADATPTATSSVSPTPAADWIDLPADFTVRTAAQAETLALNAAKQSLAATHPQVANSWLLTQREAVAATGSAAGENDDPLALVWWVDLDDDQFEIPRCPAPVSGVMRTSCGSAPIAAIQILASDGNEQGLTVGGHFAPAAESGSASIPSSAKLRTEGEAIAAGLQGTPGAGGQLPQVIDVRLLSVQQWMQERMEQGMIPNLGLDPDTPLWEVEMTNAALAVPCILLDTSQCVHAHIMITFNAITGDSSGVFSPPPVPATVTP